LVYSLRNLCRFAQTSVTITPQPLPKLSGNFFNNKRDDLSFEYNLANLEPYLEPTFLEQAFLEQAFLEQAFLEQAFLEQTFGKEYLCHEKTV